MSIRKNGPIGVTFAPAIASSICLIDRPFSSCSRQTSPTPELRMRLTTKPGTSLQVIGCLRIAWAKLKAVLIVSREVSSPPMISTSGITEAGKKKWKPTTLSGRRVSRPISVIDSEEVLEARMAWPGVASSSSR